MTFDRGPISTNKEVSGEGLGKDPKVDSDLHSG